jgi:hypothetical protein
MLDLAAALPQGFHSRGVIPAVLSFSSSPLHGLLPRLSIDATTCRLLPAAAID